jgi:hypothetical protein
MSIASGTVRVLELNGADLTEGLLVLSAIDELIFLITFAAWFMAASLLPRRRDSGIDGSWDGIRAACRTLGWNEQAWVWLMRLAVFLSGLALLTLAWVVVAP